jgi:hypothetical protein
VEFTLSTADTVTSDDDSSCYSRKSDPENISWLLEFPSQCVLAVMEIMFTKRVEKHLSEPHRLELLDRELQMQIERNSVLLKENR